MAESNSDPNESIPMRIPTSKSRGVVSALAALGAVAVVAVPAATSATAAPNHAATHHGVKPLHAGVRPAATRATSQYTLSLQTSMTHGAVSPAPKVYLVFSASGKHHDGFPNSGFCGWHDYTPSSYGNLAYTNLPYVPDEGAGACTTLTDGRLLSGIESTETHEYAETVTDFWPTDGWNNNANGEIGDECVDLDAYLTLSTGKYDVQGLWSNAANKCVTKG